MATAGPRTEYTLVIIMGPFKSVNPWLGVVALQLAIGSAVGGNVCDVRSSPWNARGDNNTDDTKAIQTVRLQWLAYYLAPLPPCSYAGIA